MSHKRGGPAATPRSPTTITNQTKPPQAAPSALSIAPGDDDRHRCQPSSPSDRALDGWGAAARHALNTGCTPLLPPEALRGLWRRGGRDRQLAHQLHTLTGGLAA